LVNFVDFACVARFWFSLKELVGMALNHHLETCIYTPVPPLPPNCRSRTVPLETLKKMAQEEERGRRGSNLQTAFHARYEAQATGEFAGETFASDIIDAMQRDVLEANGFRRNDEIALYELRTAAMQYPDEPIFQQSTFIRYNRCGDCRIADGEKMIDTILHDPVTLEPVALSELLAQYDAPSAEDIVTSRDTLQGAVRAPARKNQPVPSPLVLVTGSYT
jgi:hypothetical protein